MENSIANYATQTSPKRQPQVSEACIALEHAIENLNKTQSAIEQCLTPLLRNDAQVDGNSGPQGVQALVPLADQIQGYAVQLRRIERSFDLLLQRLEL